MEEDKILDSWVTNEPKSSFFEILAWWESKRLTYNVLLFAVEISIMTYFMNATINFGIMNAIVQTLAVNLVANFCFCLGWVIEILILYYFKGIRINNTMKMVAFIGGTLFSLFLAFTEYTLTLIGFS